jgi:hypothetical protein
VDDARFRQLLEKRTRVGLSHREANELGRLMAERDGRPYSNADQEEMGSVEPAA